MASLEKRYSAEVRLHLEVAGRSLPLRQIGPDHFIIQTPEDMPPCEADVVMHVDGRESRWHVFLVDGMSANSDRVRTRQIAFCGNAATASAIR